MALFQKGNRANPGGRPKVEKKIRQQWDALAVKDGHESGLAEWVGICREIMNDRKAPLRDRLVAAKMLKEAGYGKAKETVVLEGSGESASVDWHAVPSERKQRLLDAIVELQAYAGEPPTEH